MLHNLSSLSLVTSVLGFVVSVLLIFSAKQNRFVNRLLGIGFFALAYRSLSMFAVQENLTDDTFLMGSVSFIFYLIPPSFYLYFRAVINDEQSLKRSDWVHLAAPVLSLLLLIYYIFSGLIHAGELNLPVNESVFGNKTLVRFYIQPGIHAYLIFAIAVIYAIISWKMVLWKWMGNKPIHPQVKKMRNWVITLLITCSLLVLLVFCGAILKIIFNRDIISFIHPNILRSIILIFIFTRVLFKSDLLYGLPEMQTQLPVVDSITIPVEKDRPDYALDVTLQETRSVIDIPDQIIVERELYFDRFGWIHLNGNEELLNRLNSSHGFIEKDKVINYINAINIYLETAPYINPEFDIKSISKELQSPLYHIEYVFRYYNRYSFTELRNIMRVQYVMDNYNNGLMKNFTLEAIGSKAGFSSRSSFFRVFKLVTGKTPKQILEIRISQ